MLASLLRFIRILSVVTIVTILANLHWTQPLSASGEEGSKCASGTTDSCMERVDPVKVNLNSHCTERNACATCRSGAGTCWSTPLHIEIPVAP